MLSEPWRSPSEAPASAPRVPPRGGWQSWNTEACLMHDNLHRFKISSKYTSRKLQRKKKTTKKKISRNTQRLRDLGLCLSFPKRQFLNVSVKRDRLAGAQWGDLSLCSWRERGEDRKAMLKEGWGLGSCAYGLILTKVWGFLTELGAKQRSSSKCVREV